MNQRTTKWVLFATMVCTVPVLYFMFVVGGVLPVVAIAGLAVSGAWGFKLFSLLHILVYGPMLYLAAKWLTRWLFLLSPERRALGIIAVLALALLPSLLPIYGIGHGYYKPVNLYQLFWQRPLV